MEPFPNMVIKLIKTKLFSLQYVEYIVYICIALIKKIWLQWLYMDFKSVFSTTNVFFRQRNIITKSTYNGSERKPSKDFIL